MLCLSRVRVCPIKMSCSLINWFWMFLLSYFVGNYLPINFLSIYLPCWIRHNEFRNFTNTEYLVPWMPNLSVWLNLTESFHMHDNTKVSYLNTWLGGWVGNELGMPVGFILPTHLLFSENSSKWQVFFVTELESALSWANFSLLVARRPLRSNFDCFKKTNYSHALLEYCWG